MAWAQTYAAIDFDITAPAITHEVSPTAGVAGQVQSITANISDDSGVASATVYYLRSGAGQFKQLDMTPDLTRLNWLATFETQDFDEYVLYYIVAEDSEGNRVQKGGMENPLKLQLRKDASRTASATTTASVSNQTNDTGGAQPNWMMIGLGIVAAAVLIGASGGGDSGGPIQSDPTCCTVTFNVENVGAN